MRNQPRTKAKIPEIVPLSGEDKRYYRESLCKKSGHSVEPVIKGKLSFCRWCGKVFKPEKKFKGMS